MNESQWLKWLEERKAEKIAIRKKFMQEHRVNPQRATLAWRMAEELLQLNNLWIRESWSDEQIEVEKFADSLFDALENCDDRSRVD